MSSAFNRNSSSNNNGGGSSSHYSKVPGTNTRQAASMMVGGSNGPANRKPPANSGRSGPNVRPAPGKRGNSISGEDDGDHVMSAAGNHYLQKGRSEDHRSGAGAAAAYSGLASGSKPNMNGAGRGNFGKQRSAADSSNF